MRDLEQSNSWKQEVDSRLPVAGGGGRGEEKEESLLNGGRFSIWEDEKVLEMAGDDVCTTL